MIIILRNIPQFSTGFRLVVRTECKVFVHDRCASSKCDRETENVATGSTVRDATAADNAINGARASDEDGATTGRETIVAEPGSSVANNCDVAEMTTVAATGDIRKSGLGVMHFAAVPGDDVHSAAAAAADGEDVAPAVVSQDDETVPVSAIDVQYSATVDERAGTIDATGTSADEIAVSCHADATGTGAVSEKHTAAVVSPDGYEVRPAPIDVKDSVPAPALGQDDVGDSASNDGLVTDIDVTSCSTSANVAINEKDSVPDVAPRDDEVIIPTTSYY